jgi:hypothetical protein
LKISLALVTVLVMVAGVQSVAAEEDPYLATAFARLEVKDFPQPSRSQQQIIQQTIQAIQGAAAARRYFQIDDRDAVKMGQAGFPALALLLQSEDAWVRGMAAQTLVAVDRRRSVPFLVGLLTDSGPFDWMSDVRGHTVSATARYELRSLIPQANTYRISLSDRDKEWAGMRALQQWITFHMVYCDWQEHPKYGYYKFNPVALYTGIPSEELNRVRENTPKLFEEILVLWVKGSRSGRGEIYHRGDPITVQFGFQNVGSEITKIPWDRTDRNVHRLRLVGPNGRELPLRPNAIAPLPDRVPLLQPLFSGGSSLGWDFHLHKAYDLSQVGMYRLYYAYVPPPPEQEISPFTIPRVPLQSLQTDGPVPETKPIYGYPKGTREPPYSKKAELQFWYGRQYVNYYEFLVKGN